MPASSVRPLRKFGTVSIAKLDAPEFFPSIKGARPRVELYQWRPLKSLENNVYDGFALPMTALSDSESGRRFLPGPNVSGFIMLAALGGAAILNCLQELNSEHRFSYHATRLFFQLAPRLREFFRRDFKKEQDLYLTQMDGGDSVLPTDLGLPRSGRGKPWGLAELIHQGRAEAKTRGHDDKSLNPAAFIRLGLLKAAKQDPVDMKALSTGDALKIVRLGLFDLGPDVSPSEPDVDLVAERLLGALENHLEDDTDKFNRWFREQIDNIVHQIAKKRRPGAPMARERVRQALLEIVFRSFRYVGDCVDLQTQDFVGSIPRRRALTPLERARFDALYRKQWWLGDLPLLLLHSRFDFLEEFLCEMDSDPNHPDHPGVLLRLLSYYGTMVSRRREGDRNHKRRGKHRNTCGRRATVTPFGEGSLVVSEPIPGDFQEIAALLREAHNFNCRCRGGAEWEAGLLKGSAKTQIVLFNFCKRCGFEGKLSVSVHEFTAVGKRVKGDK